MFDNMTEIEARASILEHKIMNDTFWIGVYLGMTDKMIDYMIKTIKSSISC